MNFLFTIILGVVEGITEFLPISSTGHLVLTSKLLGLAQTDFLKSFEIAIQLGAILSVVVIYFKTLVLNKDVIKKVAAAFIPTGILGFILYKFVKTYLLESNKVILWSLLVGGILIIIFELLHKEKETAHEDIKDISYPKAALIGVAQSLAMIPGVSRSAATILGGLLLDIKRKTIVEFSFLLAVPTMLAATVYDLYKSSGSFAAGDFQYLALGFVVSFFVAWASVKFLLRFVKNHSFIAFGVYRILAAMVFWLIIF